MRRLSRALPVFATALSLAALSLAAPVRAEEPAKPAAPKALPKVKDPFLDSLVGTWDVVVTGPMGDFKGTDVWWKGAADTAYVRAMTLAGKDGEFHGFGVARVGADGKAFTLWWFDSMGQGEMAVYKGSVGADRYEAESAWEGMKIAESLVRKDKTLVYAMSMNGESAATGTWTRSEKAVTPTEAKTGKLAEHPFVKAAVGEWKVAGASGGQKHEGKSRMHVGVGGHYLLDDWSITVGGELHAAVGVYSLSPDGSKWRAWWFGNYGADPIALTGTLTDKGWTGEGPHPMGGTLKVVFSKTDAGLEGVYSIGGAEVMKTSYAKPAAK
jgi:hypothetical protein